jgi:AraC-like DNA-binding protein
VEIKSSHRSAQDRVAKFDDSEAFAAALQKVDLEVIQTGQGIFRATLAAFTTGLCDVQVGSINRPIIARGATQRGRLGFLVELRKARQWSWSGQSMGDASVALCAGGCELLLKAGPDTEWAFISVDHDVLAQSAVALYGREPPIPRRGFEIIRPDPAELGVIRGLLTESIVSLVTAHPYQTGFRLVMDGAVRRSAVRMLLGGQSSEVSKGKKLFFRRVLRRVDGFLAANLERPIQLAQLCEATGVSKQPLEEIFQEYLGIGPLRYLEIRHLYHVYRALLRADPATTAVADVARAWGFSNQRGFTVEFAALFGKSPLMVLRQPRVQFR